MSSSQEKPSLDDTQLDRLLSHGELSPQEVDAGWETLATKMAPEKATSWLQRLLQVRVLTPVLITACLLLALLVTLKLQPKDDAFTVRGEGGFHAVARCLPSCVRGAKLAFELGDAPEGHLLAWVSQGADTLWLFPDATGFAPLVAASREAQLIPQAITIPDDWRGTVDITLVIGGSPQREARDAPRARTTLRLSVLEATP